MSCQINTEIFESMFEDPNNHQEKCSIKKSSDNYIQCTCDEDYWDMENVLDRYEEKYPEKLCC